MNVIRQAIAGREVIGDKTLAAFARILLAEVHIQILTGGRRVPTGVILRNLSTLAGAKLWGGRRARALLETAALNKQLHVEGAVIARIDFDRGQLFEMSGKHAEARTCFERARVIADAQGLDGLRERSELALARIA